MTEAKPTPIDFMRAAKVKPLNGSSAWAARYAAEIRTIITERANKAPRSLQQHLGPSELGVACDRQVAGKLAGIPSTNHVTDPWPSIVGTAVHEWLAQCFEAHNLKTGKLRWLAEQRVYPSDEHGGTADLYDADHYAVVDHKVLGKTTLEKLRKNGPPRKYRVQLLLYGLGYRRLGLIVNRVAIVAYPRTTSSLGDMYVWDHELTPEDDALIAQVWEETATRKAWAELIREGKATLNDVPNTPSDDDCYFCSFYRPEASISNGPGCPGTTERRSVA